MTAVQKYMHLQGALQQNTMMVDLILRLRAIYPYNRDLLCDVIKLANEGKSICDELAELPKYISE